MPILLVARVPLECISSREGLHTRGTAHTVLNTEFWAVHPELLPAAGLGRRHTQLLAQRPGQGEETPRLQVRREEETKAMRV